MRAVIGVCYSENCVGTVGDPRPWDPAIGCSEGVVNSMTINAGVKVLWVRRSSKMTNYPLLWTLFSQQYSPDDIYGKGDITGCNEVFRRMSRERLEGSPIKVERFLDETEGYSEDLKCYVHLMLWKISFPFGVRLNPDYYIGAEWLTWKEHFRWHGRSKCGMCTRLFQDWAYLHNLCPWPAGEVPYAPGF